MLKATRVESQPKAVHFLIYWYGPFFLQGSCVLQWPPTLRLGAPLRFFLDLNTDQVGSSGKLSPWGEIEDIRQRFFPLAGRRSQRQWISVQTFSTISQEKGSTSPQRKTFLPWDRKAASHIPAEGRVIEVWIAVRLILALLPMEKL